MKKLTILVLAICLALGTISYAQEPEGEEIPITILFDGQEYEKKSEGALAAWLGYAMARAVWVRDNFTTEEAVNGEYKNSFEEEIDAYTKMVQIWRELKESDPQLSDPYLNLLERVDDAGFLKEYIWTYIHDGNWGGFPDLDMDGFDVYAKKYLVGHTPEKITTIEINTEG